MSDPHHGQRVRFGDVVRQVKTNVEPTTNHLTRFVAGEHMDTDDLHLRRWGDVGDGYLGPAFHRRFLPGQVLYGSRRTYLRKVSVPDFEGICANTTFVCEPATDDLLPTFLPLVMQSEQFHKHSIAESKGSVNPYVNWKDLAWYEFDLPSLEEQRRIVAITTAADNVREHYLSVLRSCQATTCVLRDRLVSEGEATTLGVLASEVRIGPFGSQLHARDYVDDGVPVVMPKDLVTGGSAILHAGVARVSAEKAKELRRHELSLNDILLPRRGELDRRAVVTEDEAGWLCGTGSIRVRLIEPQIAHDVAHQLAAPQTLRWLERHASGTTMPNLNADIVARVPVRQPSTRHSVLLEALREIHDLAAQTKRQETAIRSARARLLDDLTSENVH